MSPEAAPRSPDAGASAAASSLEATLDRFFRETAPLARGDVLLVAFSGGPDSTALLHGASRLGARRGFTVVAAHLDHGLDADSPRRARRASLLATSLGVDLVVERLPPDEIASSRTAPRGLEDWARARRYDFLERCRRSAGARWVATAHHRDDQIETVLLRLLLGSGLEGLGAIEPRRGPLVRPLLELDREHVLAALSTTGLRPVTDPTNDDERRPRNRLRRVLLPHLMERDPGLGDRLVRLAAIARRLTTSLDARLGRELELDEGAGHAGLDLAGLLDLPSALRPFALSLLHRAAGRPYPARAAARRELDRQLEGYRTAGGPAGGRRIGGDCGGGWRWRSRGGRLELCRSATETAPFAYTLTAPGEVVISELGLRVSIERQPVAAWMFRGHPRRAALELSEDWNGRLTVRNRRPGDRIRPLGCRYSKRLKEVLIDRGIPRERRDRLPLVCIEDRIAWVPGLTIDEAYRVTDRNHAWSVSVELAPARGEAP